jgi:hypothetical protein
MYISSLALALLGGFEIGPALIHTFAPDGGASSIAGFTNYSTAEKEILWAFGVMGTFQLFSGLLYFVVLLNVFDTRYLATPLYIWILLRASWSTFVPMIMGRETKSVAPNAPGNFKPALMALLSVIGVADEYLTEYQPIPWKI